MGSDGLIELEDFNMPMFLKPQLMIRVQEVPQAGRMYVLGGFVGFAEVDAWIVTGT